MEIGCVLINVDVDRRMFICPLFNGHDRRPTHWRFHCVYNCTPVAVKQTEID